MLDWLGNSRLGVARLIFRNHTGQTMKCYWIVFIAASFLFLSLHVCCFRCRITLLESPTKCLICAWFSSFTSQARYMPSKFWISIL
jgi:hypothetical protein